MNRRGFLKGLGLVIGGIALEQAVPLGRVWSFPAKIVPLNIGALSDYTSFSDIADSIALDPALDRIAKDLAAEHYGRMFMQNPGMGMLWWSKPVLTDGPPRPDLRKVESVMRLSYLNGTAF